MKRLEIIDKLDSLYEKADKNNIGLNETELEYKELVADWIESLVNKLNLPDVILSDAEKVAYDKGFHEGGNAAADDILNSI